MEELRWNKLKSLCSGHIAVILSQICLPSQSVFSNSMLGGSAEDLQYERVSPSVVSDSETPWTIARQAPLSMGLSKQEYWSGLPFPSPRDLPNPEIEPRSSAL